MSNDAVQQNYTKPQGKNKALGTIDENVVLRPYNIYPGRVTSAKMPNGLIEVLLPASNEPIPCVMAAGVFSALFGFDTTFYPEVETPVSVFYVNDTIAFILGTTPNEVVANTGRNRSVVDGAGFASTLQAEKLQHPSDRDYGAPIDMVEGELNLENVHGVALSLLTHLAKLQAGDLAKVECVLMDDMVRIISDKFKHFTAFGDHEIYRDGNNLDVRTYGTHRDHEAWGKETLAEGNKFEKDKKTEDPLDPENPYGDTGIWRLHKFIGNLGNFINIFVSDPISSLAAIAEGKTAAGKFRAHVNDDGSLLVQSVGDIVFERVVKIPVAVEKKRFDDPTPWDPEDQAKVEVRAQPPLENWQPGANLFEAAYQIRDYAKWFSNVYAMAQFHNDPEHYYVPDDDKIAKPDKDNKDKVKQKQNEEYAVETHKKYIYKYSTIRIYRDGSITALNSEGCAVNMVGVDVTVSATRNLNFEAGNHITFNAGNDVYIKARRHIEITAVVGGLLLRAKSWFQNLCEFGSILLESGAGEGGEDSEVKPRVLQNAGIVIKSTASSVYTSAKDLISEVCGGNHLMRSAEAHFSNKKTQFSAFAYIDSKGVTSKTNVTAPTGKFGDLPNWVYEVAQHPSGIKAPIEQLAEVTVKVGASLAKNLGLANATFQHRSDYKNVTDYESLTQQHLRLAELTPDVDADGVQIQTQYPNYQVSTSDEALTPPNGKGSPYPGKGALIKVYQPQNPSLTADAVPNSTIANKGAELPPVSIEFRTLQ